MGQNSQNPHFCCFFLHKSYFLAILGLENAKIVKIELKICKIPQIKALIMPNFIQGPKMAPFYGEKSLSKGVEKTHSPGTRAPKNLLGPLGLTLCFRILTITFKMAKLKKYEKDRRQVLVSNCQITTEKSNNCG